MFSVSEGPRSSSSGKRIWRTMDVEFRNPGLGMPGGRACSGGSSGHARCEKVFGPEFRFRDFSSSEQGSSRKRRELDPVHRQARGEAHIVPYGFARSCGPPQVRDRASRNAEQFGDRGMGFSASRCSLCIPLSNLIVFYGSKQRTGSICGSRRGPRLRGRREADPTGFGRLRPSPVGRCANAMLISGQPCWPLSPPELDFVKSGNVERL